MLLIPSTAQQSKIPKRMHAIPFNCSFIKGAPEISARRAVLKKYNIRKNGSKRIHTKKLHMKVVRWLILESFVFYWKHTIENIRLAPSDRWRSGIRACENTLYCFCDYGRVLHH